MPMQVTETPEAAQWVDTVRNETRQDSLGVVQFGRQSGRADGLRDDMK